MELRSRTQAGIDLVAGLAVIAAASIVIWSYVKPSPTLAARAPALEGKLVTFGNAPTKGHFQARLGMIVFSDFECPFCARFARDVILELDRSYVATGHLVVTHRHLPLVNVHRSAYIAAKAADCAWQERRFWPMHDLLFADPKILNRSTIEAYGAKLGLGPAWKSCIAVDANPNVDR